MVEYDEKICVHCAACASESENGGIKFERGKIIINETKIEDWHAIAAICPVGALTLTSEPPTTCAAALAGVLSKSRASRR